MAAANNKMKGLLKGLRYISQIFDAEDEEAEMQIGCPTDVKHVAHIGRDGPSINSAPSWMNDFKSPQGFSSAPLANEGEVREEDPVKWVSQDGISRKGSQGHQSCSSTDMPELHKSSKCSSSSTNENGTRESSIKEKPDKHRQSRKPSKNSSSRDVSNPSKPRKPKDSSDSSSKPRKPKDPNQATESTSQHDLPKKCSRRKKSKDSSVGGGSSRRNRTQDLDAGSQSESVSRAREEGLSKDSGFEEGEGT